MEGVREALASLCHPGWVTYSCVTLGQSPNLSGPELPTNNTDTSPARSAGGVRGRVPNAQYCAWHTTNGSRTKEGPGRTPESGSKKTGCCGSQSQGSEGPGGGAVTHWTPKGCSRIARLSHKPSIANLLAQ